jgi:hypothetical protein
VDYRGGVLHHTLRFLSPRSQGLWLADIAGLKASVWDGLAHATPYVTYALMGTVKEKTHKRHHEMYSVATTSSGLAAR